MLTANAMSIILIQVKEWGLTESKQGQKGEGESSGLHCSYVGLRGRKLACKCRTTCLNVRRMIFEVCSRNEGQEN